MERRTGVEPATSCLEGKRSAIELPPHTPYFPNIFFQVNAKRALLPCYPDALSPQPPCLLAGNMHSAGRKQTLSIHNPPPLDFFLIRRKLMQSIANNSGCARRCHHTRNHAIGCDFSARDFMNHGINLFEHTKTIFIKECRHRDSPLLFAINILTVPDTVENDLLLNDVVTDSVRPDLKPPLSDSFALELLDFRHRTKRIGFQPLDFSENPILGCQRKTFQIPLETRGKPNSKTSHDYVSQPGGWPISS